MRNFSFEMSVCVCIEQKRIAINLLHRQQSFSIDDIHLARNQIEWKWQTDKRINVYEILALPIFRECNERVKKAHKNTKKKHAPASIWTIRFVILISIYRYTANSMYKLQVNEKRKEDFIAQYTVCVSISTGWNAWHLIRCERNVE